MCTHYAPTRPEKIEHFKVTGRHLEDWYKETWPDYKAPIIRHSANGDREAVLGNYGLLPKAKQPPGKRYSTMNARAETIGELRTYSRPWKDGQLCLVPMEHFCEPCYETGNAVNWNIGLIDVPDFAVAGLYKEWAEDDGSVSYSFTQITINADEHPLMKRFHQDGEEKRSLVILKPEDWDDWLSCKNPEFARTFLMSCPPEIMRAEAAPLAPRAKKEKKPLPLQPDLLG